MPSRRELSNAIRALGMDAVQKGNSSKPGNTMGMQGIDVGHWRIFFG